MNRLLLVCVAVVAQLGAQSSPKAMASPPSLDGTVWTLSEQKSVFSAMTLRFAERTGEAPDERQLGGTWTGSLFGCAGADCSATGVITGVRDGAMVFFALIPGAKAGFGAMKETAVLTDSSTMRGIDLGERTLRGVWTRPAKRP